MISSSHVALLNQQAGCEKGPKFVEINYKNELTPINTFDKVYLVFNHNQDNVEAKNSPDSHSSDKLSTTSSTCSFKSSDKIMIDLKQVMPIFPKTNVKIIDANYTSSEFSLPKNYIK